MNRLCPPLHLRYLLFVILPSLALCVAGARPAAAEDARDALLPDPALHIRALDNGMRVWIRPNASPPGRVYLWLRIATGSLNESDGERGLAHLLEHMAFRDSANFPNGTMITHFEEMGLTLGAHQNGSTGPEHTTYTLTLPDARPDTIRQGLLALSDIAFRLKLNQQALDLERAIVLEEARLRQGPEQRIGERTRAFLLPDSRIAERAPIGTEAAIRGITLPAVEDYYRRWYRPDKAALIVVGDVDPDAVAPLVHAQFGNWAKARAPATNQDADVKLYHDTRVLVVTEPEIVRARVRLSRLASVPERHTKSDLRRSLIWELAEGAISRRLDQLTRERAVVAESATFFNADLLAPVRTIGWSAEGAPEKWKDLVRFVVDEQKRLSEHGLSADEIEIQRRALLAQLDGVQGAIETTPSAWLLDWLAEGLDDDTPPPSPEIVIRHAGPMLTAISRQDVNAAVRELMAPAAHRIVVVLPQRDGPGVPTGAQVLQVAKAAARNHVSPPLARNTQSPVLAAEPTPGRIAQHTYDGELDITSVVFENGVRLTLRPMREQKNEIAVRIRLEGGEIEETAENRGISEAAASALTDIATSRLSPGDFERMLSGRNIELSGFADRDHVLLHFASVPDALEETMRVSHALLTDARLDANVFRQWQERMRDDAERDRLHLGMQVSLAADRLFMGPDPRFRPLASEQINALKRAAAQAWLDRILRKAPLEVVIVGDFELAQAIGYAERYLASLPARPVSDPALEASRRIDIRPGPIEETITIATETPRADVYLAWRGADWKDLHDQHALYLAERLLTRRLTQALRVERGWVYSIGCYSDPARDYPGSGRFLVRFRTDPARAPEALRLARHVVEDLAANGPTKEELAIVQRQLATNFVVARRTTTYWMNGLSGMHARGETLEDLRHLETAYQRMTAEEVHEVLKRHITPERRIAIVGMPQPPAAARASAAAGGT